MGVLSGIEPGCVFRFFEEICSIPHGSRNVKHISNYLVDFAKERNLKYRQDEKYNVIIWKDGSEGYENADTVILQGHMDMVAVKVDGCTKDLETEGLDLEIHGDLISAKETSLGGDDGIAVAYALAILDDDSISHPPLEVVITVDEEIGMLGADFIDVSDLKGRLFLNMDSEDEGIFTVSCAGGATTTCIFPYKTEKVLSSVLDIRIDNFVGGHSGVEINKGRVNANAAMGRILLGISKEMDVRIVKINGGEKDNAIAKFCDVSIAVSKDSVEAAKQRVQEIFHEIKEEHKTTDPDARIQVSAAEEKQVEAFLKDDAHKVIAALVNLPNGIQRMNPEIEGLVQTSLNLGILRTEAEGVKLSYAVRSSSETEKNFLIEKISSLTEALGGKIEIIGAYPGWEYRADSRLREVMVESYKALYGEEPVVEGIHAGLECGIFASKLEDLDAVSFGPQMKDIHTTNEVLSISSTRRTWELLLKAFAALK